MLTIYRASAGTGKTHTLTGEYLQMMFASPDAYRHILAVTFTNKATEEMKNRIIQELYLLASGHSSDYMSALTAFYHQSEDQLCKQARRLLIRILHDYASFNISTIDHFFQQTMRAFVREIGLQGNYRIEMDKDLVLGEAVDNLLADLDKAEHKDLLEWLLRFSEDKVEKGQTWNLRSEIKDLADELFKENYKTFDKEVRNDIEDKSSLSQYKSSLFAIIRATETEAKQLGEKGLKIMQQYGLQPSDFSRSIMSFFERLAKGKMKEPSNTFLALPGNVETWYTKTAPPERKRTIEEAYSGGLNDCVEDVCNLFAHMTNYYTALAINRNLYTLGILNDIAHQIQLWREEKNRMLIADTTELLSKIINGSDIPFIYEKTGTRIEHYMIDEFQDTSEMQWRNFRPLVKESLAYRYANLIVGDIKQSIYRFRNSDWTLLDEQVKHDFAVPEIAEKTLAENWRSYRQIVEFNNTLFTVIPQLLQNIYNESLEDSTLSAEHRELYGNKIISAYACSYQKVAAPFQTKDGHVRIELLPDQEGHDWKEEAMVRLPKTIERLQENGYALRDIAVLVRTRNEGVMVADTLLNHKESHPDSPYHYDIISEDALLIGRASAVRFIIATLQYLNHPNNPTAMKIVQMAHVVMQLKVQAKADEQIQLTSTIFPSQKLEALLALSHRSFYETVEGIYRLFETDFPENEHVFVQAFLDLITEYTEREPTDIDQFLKWWKETGSSSKVATPDTQNAIRILTIHKAKGLGFKAVIIPFGDWSVDSKNDTILWCHPQASPFNKMHVVPISYSKDLNKTIFAEDYYHEKLHAYIDSLNTLYVAFTRAKEELIVYVPNDKVSKPKVISQLLRAALTSTVSATMEGNSIQPLSTGFLPDEEVFEWGNWWHPSGTQASEAKEIPIKRIPSVSPDERIHLRLHRKGGFFDDKKRRYGLLMHDLLSGICTQTDIETALAAKASDGELSMEEANELSTRLNILLNKPDIQPWFNGKMKVLNEAEILFKGGHASRPDRIMIDQNSAIIVDYKFGEQKNNQYTRQMEKYIKLIRDMGYSDVKGFLWYVERDEIETVLV